MLVNLVLKFRSDFIANVFPDFASIGMIFLSFLIKKSTSITGLPLSLYPGNGRYVRCRNEKKGNPPVFYGKRSDKKDNCRKQACERKS